MNSYIFLFIMLFFPAIMVGIIAGGTVGTICTAVGVVTSTAFLIVIWLDGIVTAVKDILKKSKKHV